MNFTFKDIQSFHYCYYTDPDYSEDFVKEIRLDLTELEVLIYEDAYTTEVKKEWWKKMDEDGKRKILIARF